MDGRARLSRSLKISTALNDPDFGRNRALTLCELGSLCTSAHCGGSKCLRDRTGGRRPPTHISTISVLPSWRGNFCGAIQTTVAIVAPQPLTLNRRRNFPNCSGCAGGCRFAIDPDLRADQAPVVFLPHLDPGTALLAAAPATFEGIPTVSAITSIFQRSTRDFTYWIIEDSHGRLPVVRVRGVSAPVPAAAIVPIDADFTTRLGALSRLRNHMTGRLHARPPERLTRQRRQRLALALRALDGRLAHATYRVIAQGLFGRAGLAVGAAWKTHDLRDRTIRLTRSGWKLMHGGYLDLLRSPQPRHRTPALSDREQARRSPAPGASRRRLCRLNPALPASSSHGATSFADDEDESAAREMAWTVAGEPRMSGLLGSC
jgi:hypothetical protein